MTDEPNRDIESPPLVELEPGSMLATRASDTFVCLAADAILCKFDRRDLIRASDLIRELLDLDANTASDEWGK